MINYVTASPKVITLIAVIAGIGILPSLYYHHLIIATFLLLFSGYCDTLDGTLAHHQQTTSPMGAILDIIADHIVECAIILGLFSIQPHEHAWCCLLMLSSILICVTTFLVVGIFTADKSSQKSFYYSPGLMERVEAFVFFIFMIWLPTYFNLLAILFSSLVLWTAYKRIRDFSQDKLS